MRDGAVLGLGKGNPDWNYQRQMEGIFTTTANEGSIDECPMAYKSLGRILDFIDETVSDIEFIRPIYNFKSC